MSVVSVSERERKKEREGGRGAGGEALSRPRARSLIERDACARERDQT